MMVGVPAASHVMTCFSPVMLVTYLRISYCGVLSIYSSFYLLIYFCFGVTCDGGGLTCISPAVILLAAVAVLTCAVVCVSSVAVHLDAPAVSPVIVQ